MLMFTVPPKICPNWPFWLAMFAVHCVYTPRMTLLQFVLFEKLMSFAPPAQLNPDWYGRMKNRLYVPPLPDQLIWFWNVTEPSVMMARFPFCVTVELLAQESAHCGVIRIT